MASEPSIPAESLSELYEKAQTLYDEIQISTLDSNSEKFQESIDRCCARFEHLTVLVAQIALFSTNEIIEELPTSSIKFLLLPAVLGNLTLQRKCSTPQPCRAAQANGSIDQNKNLPDRLTILRLAKVYFRDFITRCKQYGITSVELPQEADSDQQDDTAKQPLAPRGRPTPQELQAMGRERDQKIRTFKAKKALQEKLNTLKLSLKEADEETLREYYHDMIEYAIITSMDELGSISTEDSMLRRMATLQLQPAQDLPKRAPVQPFLITRDAIQKKVYGMGYPSLPIMSVDEFYTKRVEEGWFPPSSNNTVASSSTADTSSRRPGVVAEHVGSATDGPPELEQGSDDEDSDRNRARLVDRDEYRDQHRRGWGNTYNRS